MSMTALRSHLYDTPIPEYEEAKLNAMHATFSLMHVYPRLDRDVLAKGNNLFATLFFRYFKTNLTVFSSLQESLLNIYSFTGIWLYFS